MTLPSIEQLLTTPTAPPPTVKNLIAAVADGAAGVVPTDKPQRVPWTPTAAIAAMTTVPPKQIQSQEI
jgi:hypothetical protein